MTDWRGAKYTSGEGDRGRVTLIRSDGSVQPLPNVVIVDGLSMTDNGDGTVSVTVEGI